jgi:hypothetical protein
MDRRTFVGAAATAGTAAALSALAGPPEATARNAAAGEQSPPQSASGQRGQNAPSAAQPTLPANAPPAAFYGGPDSNIPKAGLRWAFSATVFFADRIMIGSPVPRGYTSVGGGEIWGPRLQGRVRPASGADYYKGTFSTYYMFEASDGALIFIHNRGTMRRFQAPPEAGKALTPATTTDPTTPGWMRFRATPVFTAPVGPHDWMNRTVFVANSQRQSNPDHTVFTYYEVL